MHTKLRHIWEVLSSGYWFIPGLMTLTAVGLAFAMLLMDRAVLTAGSDESWLYSGGAEGARELLSTIASSIITVAGVVFSITIVALTQASSQFGPRLLRHFMRDTANQVVLGTFVATFVYCLLVLRTIRGYDQEGFVPHAATTVGVLLAVASIAVLIYFIHHVSMSLQAPMVVAAVAGDLTESIAGFDKESSQSAAGDEENDGPPDWPEGEAAVVTAWRDGYVQAIDYQGLARQACRADLVVRLTCRPGDYVIEDNPILHAWPGDRCGPEVWEDLRDTLIIGRRRTSEQDLEYAIHQLVEVAVRALSPGVNDPFTAINCVDALGASLCRIARHRLPPTVYRDEKGAVRVIARTPTFEGIVDAAFTQIRQYGRNSASVMIRMLEVITATTGQITSPEGRAALRRHVEIIYSDGQEAMPQEQDRQSLGRRYEAAVAALNA